MTFSIREHEVLDVVNRCEAMGIHVLEQHFEERIPHDELRLVVRSLKEKGAVIVMPGSRNATVAITSIGRAAQEKRRG